MKEILITSSVLIGALLLLRLIFAKKVRRGLIYAAWALVALRLLIPVQIGQLDFSVLTAAQPLTETVEEVSELRVVGQNEREASIQVTKDYIERDQTVFTPEVQEYIQSAQKENRPAEEIANTIVKTQGSQLYVPEVREQVAQQVAEQTAFVSIGQLAKIIWLSGVAAMAVWFAIVNLRHGYLLRREAKKLDCESPIPVFVSEKVASPCLVGLFRPAVYLTPQSAVSEKTLRHVLTHELTHYRHGDHIWSLVRCVCLCVYWFDPLVWLAAYMSRRDCELACDEGALQQLGEAERIAYGRTLLEVVSHAARHANLLQTATSMNETKKQLKERVNFIVKKRKISITAAICMVLVCAIVAGCVATGPASTQQNPEKDPPVTTPTSTPATTPSTNGSTQPTDPKPTEPAPTEPIDKELEKINNLFGYEYGWYNRALFRQYTNPSKIELVAVFHQGFEEESKEPTDAEWEQLKDQPGFNINYDLMRLPVDRMNQVLMDLFGITLEDVDEAGFEGLVYLESTNCYYHMTDDAWSVRGVNAFDMETLEDGTIRVYYTASGGSTVFCVTVMPHNGGYRILSNITWPAPTTQPLPDTPTEVLEEFNALFGDLDSWYNMALTSEYATPEQIDLYEFFLNGFPGEFTDEERAELDEQIAELEEQFGGELPTYSTKRLPADQMNQVLTDLFGITLEDVDPESALNYLEKTNCYYIIGGGASGTMEFNAVSVEYLEDDTIRVYYTADWESTVRCVTLMPHGDGYRILSNVCVE